MRAMLWVAIAVVILSGSAAGRAEKPKRSESYGYGPAFDTCMPTGDAASGVTIGILHCNDDEIGRQDVRLNRNYKLAMARSLPARRVALRLSERRWIKERMRHCDREADAEGGGTLATIIHTDCFLAETARRADWLEHYR